MASLEKLIIQTVCYQDLEAKNPEAISQLSESLRREGAVAISKVPGFPEQRTRFFEESIAFSQFSEEKKSEVASGGTSSALSYLGYDVGKEQFQDADGVWRVDSSKHSYYMYYPDQEENKWPDGVSFKETTLKLCETIRDVGCLILEAVDLIGDEKFLPDTKGIHGVGRVLHYTPCDRKDPNPLWCGTHADHGLITGLIAPEYRIDGKSVEQPPGAGLQIKVGDLFHEILTSPEDIIYQIGDFGQLVSSDRIMATPHKVSKPNPPVDDLHRHTFALFINASFETPVPAETTSKLTLDSRYKEGMTFEDWHLASLKRYENKNQ